MTWYRVVAAIFSLTFLGLCLVTGVYAAWRVLTADDSAEYGCEPGLHCTKED